MIEFETFDVRMPSNELRHAGPVMSNVNHPNSGQRRELASRLKTIILAARRRNLPAQIPNR
jgi:hypothetical protein